MFKRYFIKFSVDGYILGNLKESRDFLGMAVSFML